MSMPVLEQVVAGRAPDLFPLTVDQYHHMIAQGILREGQPVELIDGVLVYKDRSDRGGDPMSHGRYHAVTLGRVLRKLRPLEETGCHLRSQLPITLANTQEPEPDAAVIRGALEDYLIRHPGPGDILAVVEVADSSVSYDRTTKLRLYAGAGVPVYWIVNIPDGQIEVYERPLPAEGRYEVRTDVRPGQAARLTAGTANVEMAVADVLPPMPPGR